ncbi:hypothetical protein Cyrtocomes_00576 [Candidatus Cyrtobacter comes]|uniref:Uncharacterized protein n=1 Tax=Candidatus Cyrtobacter comes TaxID=675776 RepID=A0ABU5L7U4_9RICK|nr:hypothetical protein [Candidatus Cyrtobacter comes]MDZ5762203.1 hypothetical protein [Candidatus Cyrtobacter comes]
MNPYNQVLLHRLVDVSCVRGGNDPTIIRSFDRYVAEQLIDAVKGVYGDGATYEMMMHSESGTRTVYVYPKKKGFFNYILNIFSYSIIDSYQFSQNGCRCDTTLSATTQNRVKLLLAALPVKLLSSCYSLFAQAFDKVFVLFFGVECIVIKEQEQDVRDQNYVVIGTGTADTRQEHIKHEQPVNQVVDQYNMVQSGDKALYYIDAIKDKLREIESLPYVQLSGQQDCSIRMEDASNFVKQLIKCKALLLGFNQDCLRKIEQERVAMVGEVYLSALRSEKSVLMVLGLYNKFLTLLGRIRVAQFKYLDDIGVRIESIKTASNGEIDSFLKKLASTLYPQVYLVDGYKDGFGNFASSICKQANEYIEGKCTVEEHPGPSALTPSPTGDAPLPHWTVGCESQGPAVNEFFCSYFNMSAYPGDNNLSASALQQQRVLDDVSARAQLGEYE